MGELTQPRPTITVERATEFDIKEAMQGSTGNPSYEQQFGITSAPLGTTGLTPQPSIAELEIEAQKALARATNPLGYLEQSIQGQQNQPQIDYNAELQKYQKLYGDSENEKGQLRKNQQELMDAFNGLMTQYEAMQASMNQPRQSWNQPVQPQMQFGQQQFQNPFDHIKDEDFVDGKTVKSLVEQTIAPALSFIAGQNQDSLNRVAQLEQQIARQAYATSGLSKFDEFRIASKNPWLNRLPMNERLAAIQSLKQSETPQGNGNGQQNFVPQQTQTNDSQQRILNRVTYIEGNNPNVPDQTEAALEAAKQRDYAIVMNAPQDTGERARLFRQFANKYGIQLGQNPSDLAR